MTHVTRPKGITKLALMLAALSSLPMAGQGAFPPATPTSDLTLNSANADLVSSFNRAKTWALKLVVTNGYVAHDEEPQHRVDFRYDGSGSVTSNAVTLTVTAGAGGSSTPSSTPAARQVMPFQAPVITAQPSSQMVAPGQRATFTVGATGSNLTYQWKKNGQAIFGAFGATYTTPPVTAADNGAVYTVVVTAVGLDSNYVLLTGTQIPVTDPLDGTSGFMASAPLAAYWGTYAPASTFMNNPSRGRECFCSRDISHSTAGAHLLGLDKENFTMMYWYAAGANANGATPGAGGYGNIGWPKWSYSFYGDPFYMDSDWRELAMPFDVASRMWNLFRWTGDSRYLNDPEIRKYQLGLHTSFAQLADADKTEAEKSVGKTFNDLQDQNGNGIAEEHIQLATYWEQAADNFIEASDSFGYQVQSMQNLGKALLYQGDSSGQAYLDKAAALRQKFHDQWYDWTVHRYIRGFDTAGNYSTTWGHESSLLVSHTGLGDLGARDALHTEWIHTSTYLDPTNIESTTYYPEAMFNYGRSELGWYWLKYDMYSGSPYPEVSYVMVANIVNGMMGVQGQMEANTVRTLPRLTDEVPWVEVANIPVGQNKLKVRHDGNTKTTVTNTTGAAITWQASFYGFESSLEVDNVSTATQSMDLNGRQVVYVNVTLAPGQTSVVQVPTVNLGYDYLGDLTPASATVAPVKDGAVKTINNGKHDIIMLGLKPYGKGLGTAAGNTLTYALGGGYSRFTADLGLDAGAGGHGNAVVTILKDSTVISTTTLIGSAPVVPLNLDVSGANTLTIQVADGGTGTQNNFVDFGNAVLHKGSSAATETAASTAVSMKLQAPAQDATALVFPAVPADYQVSVRKTSNPGLVGLNGAITPPDFDEPVQVVLDVTAPDSSVAQTDYQVVMVPGKTPDTAALAAARIVGVNQPHRADTQLNLTSPALVPPGFTVAVASCSDTSVLDLTGAIKPDINAHALTVTLLVTKLSDGSTATTKPLPVAVPSLNYDYATDLDWTSATAAYSTMIKDKTVNGTAITLGGTTYTRGIDAPSPSKVVYNVGGVYQAFSALCGLDGSDTGTVTFVVQADGVEVYRSAPFSNGMAPMPVNVDITGAQTLTLIVENSTVNNSPKADWADAKLWLKVIETAPSFLVQPVSATVRSGSPATFKVSALGGNLHYQWQRNGVDIPGATANPYTFTATSADNNAAYDVKISNTKGGAVSASATLTVQSQWAPSISTQPQSVTVEVGQPASFSVVADGGVLNYQWMKNGVAIPGANAPTYSTPPTVDADNGATYSVVVSNSAGSVTSNNAVLTTTTYSYIYLTDLNWSSLVVGWGTPVKDKSIDGNPLTVGGTTYLRGLGLHATADATYQLNGQYPRFTATAGIDGEVGSTNTAATVSFIVKGDGNVLYTSPVVHASDAPLAIDVNTSGVNTLDLIVTDGGDGINSDHGDFADAKLYFTAAPAPTITTDLVDVAVASGAQASFSIVVNGSGLSYQWYRNNVAIQGATSSSYALTTADADNNATFYVVVTYQGGALTSRVAKLTITSIQVVSVSVSPATATVQVNGTQAFTATVSGSANTGVTWTATAGGITSAGVFTAPATAQTVTVTATSVADPSKSASALVTVAPVISVNVSPTTATVQTNGTKAFTATVSGTANNAVNWTASAGSITSAGLFTAPATAQTVTITATSVADPTKSASATVTVVPAIAVTVSPATASVQANGTQTFTATVSGTANNAVNWTASAGSITSAGVFTAPATAQTVTITATSVADPTKSASATVTVTAAPVVSVSIGGTPTSLKLGESATFVASVSGSSNQAVTWTATGGTITTTGGVFTATASGTATVTATSVADPTKSATVSFTVNAVAVSVSPATATVQVNGTQAFTATVTGGINTGVNWTASAGTITLGGVFTAPATAQTVTITATSVADQTKTATATVTVTNAPAPVTVTIAGTPSSIKVGGSATFTATVTGSTNTAVTWTATGGPISAAGVFKAVHAGTATVTATSVADPTKSVTVTFTVAPRSSDTTSNGIVDVLDLARICQAWNGATPIDGTNAYLSASDLNGDGLVDDNDIDLFLKNF
ncbi:hypothetical protein GETHLI_12650 [Geothrix limicola]|uniref:Ig-like domain-containing protein n=1 Tax=Geothrix limicola TaxID=2927978 RepID=A0ABQ5QEF5_9BACT|nr:NPCBM/NEW2 domain-containing protein [Geothrix limicola]GLH72763.1 hypothetical protein GETHLI_12650 [Geothrix limicola]